MISTLRVFVMKPSLLNHARCYSAVPMAKLRGGLSTVEYFTFGFGTMIGVGWLVLMDDWLSRGGPAGGMLGFLIGGLLLFPIAHTYGRLVQRIRDAGAEIAYTEGGLSTVRQLRGRLDDGPVVRDRVSVGSRRDRQPAGARLSLAQQLPAVRGRRQPDLRAAARGRPGAHRAHRRRQLPRHQTERDLSGRDDVRAAGDVCDLHAARLHARIGREHGTAVLASRHRKACGCRSSWFCRSCRTS